MKIKHLIKKFLSFLKSPVGYIGIKNYISYMNQTAKSLGMNDSFFLTPQAEPLIRLTLQPETFSNSQVRLLPSILLRHLPHRTLTM